MKGLLPVEDRGVPVEVKPTLGIVAIAKSYASDLSVNLMLEENDSNYYCLPLGRMARTEAPPNQERRPRRTDGRGERRDCGGNRRARGRS